MEIIRANLERYNNAPKRIDKSLVVSLIVSSLKDDGYKFVRQDTKSRMWFQLSEPQVHEKAGHAIRDILKKGGNAVQQQSQSKQAINTSNNFDSAQTNEPDIVASQILSTALKVSKLVEKSKLDFTALSCSQTMAPDYVASSDPQRRNSREYRRSSIVRLFDELSPEEPADALSSGGFMNDQPLPIDARNSGALRTSDMMQVFESLANSTSDAPHHQRQQQGEEEEESIITPRSKRMGSSSREFRRSELLQFLDFNEDELMEPEEQAKGTPSTDQPLSMDSRTSDTLNSLFKDQEDIFSNLQNVFGSLPDAANADQSPQEMEERNSRASQVLSELLKRQEGIFEELQNFEAEFDVQ